MLSLPHSQLEVIPGAGHVCHLDAPERFADLVHAFIDKRALRGPASRSI